MAMEDKNIIRNILEMFGSDTTSGIDIENEENEEYTGIGEGAGPKPKKVKKVFDSKSDTKLSKSKNKYFVNIGILSDDGTVGEKKEPNQQQIERFQEIFNISMPIIKAKESVDELRNLKEMERQEELKKPDKLIQNIISKQDVGNERPLETSITETPESIKSLTPYQIKERILGEKNRVLNNTKIALEKERDNWMDKYNKSRTGEYKLTEEEEKLKNYYLPSGFTGYSEAQKHLDVINDVSNGKLNIEEYKPPQIVENITQGFLKGGVENAGGWLKMLLRSSNPALFMISNAFGYEPESTKIERLQQIAQQRPELLETLNNIKTRETSTLENIVKGITELTAMSPSFIGAKEFSMSLFPKLSGKSLNNLVGKTLIKEATKNVLKAIPRGVIELGFVQPIITGNMPSTGMGTMGASFESVGALTDIVGRVLPAKYKSLKYIQGITKALLGGTSFMGGAYINNELTGEHDINLWEEFGKGVGLSIIHQLKGLDIPQSDKDKIKENVEKLNTVYDETKKESDLVPILERTKDKVTEIKDKKVKQVTNTLEEPEKTVAEVTSLLKTLKGEEEKKTEKPVKEKKQEIEVKYDKGLYLKVGENYLPVKDYKDASERYRKTIDELGIGGEEAYNKGLAGNEIFNEKGETLAHISYNGRVWEGKNPKDGKMAEKILYDPGKEKVDKENLSNITEVKGKFQVKEPDGNLTNFVKKEDAIKWRDKLYKDVKPVTEVKKEKEVKPEKQAKIKESKTKGIKEVKEQKKVAPVPPADVVQADKEGKKEVSNKPEPKSEFPFNEKNNKLYFKHNFKGEDKTFEITADKYSKNYLVRDLKSNEKTTLKESKLKELIESGQYKQVEKPVSSEPKAEKKVSETKTEKQPYERRQVEFISKKAEKIFPLDSKVEIKNGKPIYTYSTTVLYDGKKRTFQIESKSQPNATTMVERLHKKIVETALSEGKTIPEEVLKDYPELKKPAESEENIVKLIPFGKSKNYKYFNLNKKTGEVSFLPINKSSLSSIQGYELKPLKDNFSSVMKNYGKLDKDLKDAINKFAKEEPVLFNKLINKPTQTEEEAITQEETIQKSKNETARETGTTEVNGKKITRQEPIKNIVTGKETTVHYAKKDSEKANYVLIEKSDLQPSHINGIENEKHFLKEAQPRDRGKTVELKNAANEKAKNLDVSKMGMSPDAYSGPTNINERGEVIQGSGRGEAMYEYYRIDKEDSKGYKNFLKENAESFGFKPEDIDKFKEPVLARMHKVTDERAIKLGNYTNADLEDIADKMTKVKATINQISPEKLSEIADMLSSRVTEDNTLKDIIRDMNDKIIRKFQELEILRKDATELYLDEKGNIKGEGVDEVYNIIKGLLFKDGDTQLPRLYEKIPYATKQALDKSIIHILSVPKEKSILPEIQNAIKGLYEFQNSKADFDTWLNQADAFNPPANEKYNNLELELIDLFSKIKKQNELIPIFSEYRKLISGTPADLFEPEVKGISKKQAVIKAFNIEGDYKDGLTRSESTTDSKKIVEGTPEEKPPTEPESTELKAQDIETSDTKQEQLLRESTEPIVKKPEIPSSNIYEKTKGIIKKNFSLEEPSTAKEVQGLFTEIIENKEQVVAEIKTAIDNNPKFKGRKEKTKLDLAEHNYGVILDKIAHLGDDTISYMMHSDTYENARQRVVDGLTDEKIKTYFEKRKADKEKNKKAIDNPETVSEFQTASYYRDLTPDEVDRFEDLKTIEKKQWREKNKQYEKDQARGLMEKTEFKDYNISKEKDTRDNSDLWVVRLNDRVEKDEYFRIRDLMKSEGGFYSKFKKGFLFKQDPTAKLSGVVGEEISSETKIEKQDEKLIDKANKQIEKAEEIYNQDRLENTDRRGRMADNIRAEQRRKIQIGKTAVNIAEAISKGEVKLLDKINNMTEVEELEGILVSAKYNRGNEENQGYDKIRERNPVKEDIRFAKLPRVTIGEHTALKLIENNKTKRIAKKLEKRVKYFETYIKSIKNPNKGKYAEYYVNWIKDGRNPLKEPIVKSGLSLNEQQKIRNDINKLERLHRGYVDITDIYRDLINLKMDTYDRKHLEEQAKRVNRLAKIGIETGVDLRAYLREYLDLREGNIKKTQEEILKEKEREITKHDIPGFFPTPKELVSELIEDADIKEGDRLLEPSAGKGNIADVLSDKYPDNELSTIEYNNALSEILKEKGYDVVDSDFLLHNGTYDKIVMNPPFEDKQDIKHVKHAYSLLRPGGRIVAIMSGSTESRTDKETTEFRTWLENIGGVMERLPEDSFKSSEKPTGVSTVKVIIDKPAEDFDKPAFQKPEGLSDEGMMLGKIGDPKNYVKELETYKRQLEKQLDRFEDANELQKLIDKAEGKEKEMLKRALPDETKYYDEKLDETDLRTLKDVFPETYEKYISITKEEATIKDNLSKINEKIIEVTMKMNHRRYKKQGQDFQKSREDIFGKKAIDDESQMTMFQRPVFFSGLERIATDKLPNTATAQQIKNTLLNNGVKQAEYDWLGVDEFLQGKEKVSKQELLDFIRSNKVEVKEVVKGKEGIKNVADYLNMIKGNLDRFGKKSLAYKQMVDAIKYLENHKEIHNDSIEKFKKSEVPYEVKQFIPDYTNMPTTKFSKWQLPGGENYREVLLTLPTGNIESSNIAKEVISVIKKLGRLGFNTEGEAIAEVLTNDNYKKDYDIDESSAIIFDKFRNNQKYLKENIFKSTHFDEPNIAVHLRMNDRITADGKKILFLEEVQSDWGQKGKKEGYAKTDKEIELARKELGDYINELEKKYNNAIYQINKDNLLTETEKAKIDILQAKQREGSKVPNMPFKKNWQEVGMKWALRYASENGYDGIGWTTGEQQAERYDLSKQVKEVKIYPYKTYKDITVEHNKGSFPLKINNDGVVTDGDGIFIGKKLDEVLGKDLAEKIMKLEKTTSFSGLDLKVADKGMSGFYDKILIDYLNKYTKKWGGKVEEGNIKIGKGYDIIQNEYNNQWYVRDEKQNIIHKGGFENKKDAEELLNNVKNKTNIHTLPITDAMKESVMEGQPMFKQGKATPETLYRINVMTERLQKALPNIKVNFVNDKQFKDIFGKEGYEFLKEEEIPFGATHKGEVYINIDRASSDTPIHEFGHIWNRWAKVNRPELHKAGMEIVEKDIALLDKVSKMYPELREDYDKGKKLGLLDEALAYAIGKNGDRLFEEMQGKEKQTLIKKFQDWLSKLWNGIKNHFTGNKMQVEKLDLRTATVRDFSNAVARDLLSGKKLSEVRSEDLKSTRERVTDAADRLGISYLYAGEKAREYNYSDKFKGKYDDKTRFEIDDSKAKIKRVDLDEYLPPLKGEELLDVIETPNKLKLFNILEHEELYKSYPNAKNITVDFYNNDSRGSYSEKENNISLNPELAYDKEELKSTLLHEIQHNIQHIEGFAKGGNVNRFTISKEDESTMESIIEIQKGIKKAGDIKTLLKNPSKYVNSEMAELIKDYNIEELKDYLREEKTKLSNSESIKRLKKSLTPGQAYKLLAGEIEARDVQARRDFTEFERSKIEPYTSENIKEEDAIVQFQKPEPDNPNDRLSPEQKELLKLENLPQVPGDMLKNRKDYLLSDDKFVEKKDDLKLLSTIIIANNKGLKKEDFVKALNGLMSNSNLEPVLLKNKQAEDLWNESKPIAKNYVKEVQKSENETVENKKREIKSIRQTKKKESGFTAYERLTFENFNRFEPLQRYADEKYSLKDPQTYAMNYLNRSAIVTEMVKGDSFPILQKDGNYKMLKGTVKDYLKIIKDKKLDEAEFENFLIARRVLEDYAEYDRLKVELDGMINSGAKPNKIAEQKEKLIKKQKQILTDNFDEKQAQQLVNDNESKYKEVTTQYDEINKRLLTIAENTGLIDKEKADLYRDGKNYTSFKRYIEEIENGAYGTDPATKLSNMKERKGSKDLEIISPIYSQIKAIQETVSKGFQNLIWSKVYELSLENETLKKRFERTKSEKSATIKFKHNGKEIYVKADMEFIKVAQNLRPKEFDAFSQVLRMPVNTFTRLTTSANPFFALVNIPRDQLTALFTTKTGMIPVFHPVKSLIHLIKGTPLAKKYIAIGGKRQTLAAYMDLSPEDVTHKLTGGETKTEKVGRVLNSSLGILEIPSNVSEIMTRLAEFERAKEKKGLSDLEAMYLATDVTIPFQLQGNYGGTLGREYVKSVAYMNANMQGLYKTLRSAKENPIRLATVTAGAIASALTSTILMMMYSNDEQKRLLSNQPVKELSRAIFFPSPNGKDLIRIPIPDLIGGITGLVQLFVISQYDGNKSSFKDYATAILQGLPQQLNPIEFQQWWTSLIPQVAKPVTEIIFNKRTYPEVAPIVPEHLKRFPPGMQYNDYTSKVANFIGDGIGVSPMYIEHFVKGQFGTLGNLLIGLPEGRYMNRIGLYRQEERFVMSGRAYNRFYDVKEQVMQEYNKIKDDNNIDPGYYTNVKSKKIITDEISEIFSDATKVLKKEKNLPENVKQKGYDLLLSIYNNESENKIIRLTEEYSKSVTKMLKDKNIETDRKDFTKTGLRLTIVKDRMDKLLDLWERTGNEKYQTEWNKLNDELDEIKDSDWYKENNKISSDKTKKTKSLKVKIKEEENE